MGEIGIDGDVGDGCQKRENRRIWGRSQKLRGISGIRIGVITGQQDGLFCLVFSVRGIQWTMDGDGDAGQIPVSPPSDTAEREQTVSLQLSDSQQPIAPAGKSLKPPSGDGQYCT